MADIALIWNSLGGFADIDTQGNDLLADEGLQTALIISVFSDRLADTDDELPAEATDVRGWWGDVGEQSKYFIGSKLWLLEREKQLSQVVTKAKKYVEEAVQWLIDDKVSNRVDVLVESIKFQELDIQISVYRPNGNIIKSRYAYNWKAQEFRVIS